METQQRTNSENQKSPLPLVSGRIREELLMRCVEFGTRCLRLIEKLEAQHRSRRIVDQLAGSGVGGLAHYFEASEALSTKDFIKTLGIAAKELGETQYWLRIVYRAQWIDPALLEPLMQENQELLRITKSLIARSQTPRTP